VYPFDVMPLIEHVMRSGIAVDERHLGRFTMTCCASPSISGRFHGRPLLECFLASISADCSAFYPLIPDSPVTKKKEKEKKNA
jgi:hypothetical protein